VQNPDQTLIHQFENGSAPLAINSNPFANAIAAQLLHVDREAGRIELAFAPNSSFTQGAGVVQGGIVCAMLDFAMAFAVLARLPPGETATTVNINVSYLRAAAEGRLLATGGIDRVGKTMAFAHARLTAPDGTLLATANSTLAVLR
jgi:uncharacterized protein (TIGR00369 family)